MGIVSGPAALNPSSITHFGRYLASLRLLKLARYYEGAQLLARGMAKSARQLLVTLMAWAEEHVPPEEKSSMTLLSRDTGEALEPVLTDANTGQRITHRNVTARRNTE